MNNSDRGLFNHACFVQKKFFETDGNYEKHIDVNFYCSQILLSFKGLSRFTHKFLEPVVEYFIKKNVSWDLKVNDNNELIIRIYS